MPSRTGDRGRPWRRIVEQVKREETHCWRCGKPVNTALSGLHPQGPMAGHVIAVANGGAMYDRANVRLEHRRCGLQAGDRDTTRPKLRSREW